MSELRIAEILDQLARDSHVGWSVFLDEHAGLIFQVVRHFEQDSDDAADCFQFICEQLCADRFRRLRRFDADGAAQFSTWLRVVARNLCLDWRRKQFGRKRVFRSIARLPELDREVFKLIYERGETKDEVLAALSHKFPYLTTELLSESLERIEQNLSTNQKWLLQSRVAFSTPRGNNSSREIDRVEVVDPQPTPESLALDAEHHRILNRALMRLSDHDRLLLRLRFEEQLTLDQIGKLLQLGNAQRVDRQLKQILATLKIEFDSNSSAGVSGKTSSSSVKAV